MEITDPNRLRVQGLDLLIDTLPPATQLGAVEFGSGFEFNIEGIANVPAADTVFPPAPVGANGTSMKAALKSVIKADNGATDYNGAFARSDADNPTAQARIFLTDGGHDVGEYMNGHLTHNVPTYVIGFGSGIAPGPDQERLKKVAGRHRRQVLPPDRFLSAAIGDEHDRGGAELPDLAASFTDKLAKGQSKIHQLAIGASTKSIQIALTWASPLDHFKIAGFKLINNGKPVAVAARLAHPRKLKIKQTGSTTFTLVKVTGLSRGASPSS